MWRILCCQLTGILFDQLVNLFVFFIFFPLSLSFLAVSVVYMGLHYRTTDMYTAISVPIFFFCRILCRSLELNILNPRPILWKMDLQEIVTIQKKTATMQRQIRKDIYISLCPTPPPPPNYLSKTPRYVRYFPYIFSHTPEITTLNCSRQSKSILKKKYIYIYSSQNPSLVVSKFSLLNETNNS